MKFVVCNSCMTLIRVALVFLVVSFHVARADTLTIGYEGFAVPESIEYYADGDIYFVSNVKGHPLDMDGNGFISKLSPAGDILESRWLESRPESYTLHGPKGLAIAGNHLYVADLQEVHIFSLPEGNHLRTIPIEGASVLNGASPASDDSIIVSDTGYAKSEDGIAPSGTDALYRVWQDGRYELIAQDESMGNPNGVYYVSDTEILVVTFGSGELFRMNMNGERENLSKPPLGTLDGVEKLADGRILVSSWEGDAIYALDIDGNYSTLVSSVKDVADLGFDSRRNRLLMPLTNSNQIAIHKLSQ